MTGQDQARWKLAWNLGDERLLEQTFFEDYLAYCESTGGYCCSASLREFKDWRKTNDRTSDVE